MMAFLPKAMVRFIGISALLLLSLATFADQGHLRQFGFSKARVELVSLDDYGEYHEYQVFTQLRFEFGNWIPEGIRSIPIRLVNLPPAHSDFFPCNSYIYIPVVTPVYQPVDFKKTPDFVGFLFRLKPF